MKKPYILLAALASFASCSVEETSTNEMDAEMVTLNASIANAEDIADSRTTIADSDESTKKNIIWNDGDAISISAGGGAKESSNSKFTLVSGEGTTQGSFRGQQPRGTSDYFGVYPYKTSTELLNTSYSSTNPNWQISFEWDGQNQTATLGTYDPEKAVMMGSTQFFSDGIALKNVMAYVKFTTNYHCKSVVFVANKNEKIACKSMTIEMDSDGIPKVVATDSDTTAVTLTGADGADIDPGTYLIPMLPVTLGAGFTMIFTSCEDETLIKVADVEKEVALTRSKILNIGEIDLSRLRALKGSGTTEDPYLISNLTELEYMRVMVNDKTSTYASREWYKACYKQTADIDASGTTLIPMGDYDQPFQGSFDGGGFTISNPTYSAYLSDKTLLKAAASGPISGLFGLTQGAKFNDIHVKDPKFNLDYEEGEIEKSYKGYIISPIVAYVCATSSVTNCSASGACSFTGIDHPIYFGGMVGISAANITIEGCTNETVTSVVANSGKKICLGGIVGQVMPIENNAGHSDTVGSATISINKCRNDARLTATSTKDNDDSWVNVGGIIGSADGEGVAKGDVVCKIYNCVNTGDVKAVSSESRTSRSNVGGIVGHHNSDGDAESEPYFVNCLNRGYITSDSYNFYSSYCGGIVGYSYHPILAAESNFHLCVNTGMLKSNDDELGAICGNTVGNFNYCWNTVGSYPICYGKDADDSDLVDCGQTDENSSLVNYMNAKVKVNDPQGNVLCFWTMSSPSSIGRLDLAF